VYHPTESVPSAAGDDTAVCPNRPHHTPTPRRLAVPMAFGPRGVECETVSDMRAGAIAILTALIAPTISVAARAPTLPHPKTRRRIA